MSQLIQSQYPFPWTYGVQEEGDEFYPITDSTGKEVLFAVTADVATFIISLVQDEANKRYFASVASGTFVKPPQEGGTPMTPSIT